MTLPDDGGQAFPSDAPKLGYSSPGMSLRDYFAAQALVGLVALDGGSFATDAMCAYAYADEMLAARGKVKS